MEIRKIKMCKPVEYVKMEDGDIVLGSHEIDLYALKQPEKKVIETGFVWTIFLKNKDYDKANLGVSISLPKEAEKIMRKVGEALESLNDKLQENL